MTTEVITDAPERPPTTELRFLADMYAQAQKFRVACENRARSIEQGADVAEDGQREFSALLGERYKAIEEEIFGRMSQAVKDHPAWPWLSAVKGIGPTLATKILGMIPEIEGFETMSQLWRYCGLAVMDGKAERKVKGEKLHYNNRLKTTMYIVAGSFLKSGSPFRRIYDEARAYYTEMRPDWTEGHRHLAALRKMEKVFLGCLYIYWREAEGLPVRDPYPVEKLGHTTVFRPEEFAEVKVKMRRKKTA